MEQTIDYAAFELGAARPRLRDDLRFSLRPSRHGPSYIIEDETNSKFYRVGLAEYTFLSLLDGKTTVQSAVAATSAKLGHEAFREAEAAALCKWLIDAGLADKKRHDFEHWNESRQRKTLAARMQWINPIMVKIPLGNPDKVVTAVSRLTAPLFNWLAALVFACVCVVALILMLSRADELFTAQSTIFARDNWLLLAIVWMGLRVIHEAAHALTCKQYGGRVRQWGILFLLFIPMPYVDVTTAWRFPSRRSRILTSAAGMMAELFIAALAVFVWYHSDPGLLKQNAVNVMLAASVTTLLFNANPLMRFDGYHILADTLDAPNLWTHGRQYIRSIGRRTFFGLGSGNPAWRPSQAMLVRIYGVSATCWKVFIFVSLTLTAASLLHGIGLIFAVTAGALWIGAPSYQIIRFLIRGTETEQPNRRQFVLACGGFAAVLIGCGLIIPAPSVISASAVIEHDPLTIVRAKAPGFIVEVAVTSGQSVSQGDVICRLENVELESELRTLRAQLRTSQQRLRAYQSSGEPAAAQIELESTRDLQKRLSELQELVDQLVIRSPASGAVLTGDLPQSVGMYVEPGSEIISIGGIGPRKAIALVSQDASTSLQQLQGSPADLRVWGSRGIISGSVDKVHPRAQTSLPHFAFAAPAGGDLAVVATSESAGVAPSGQDWMLAQPHVRIDITLQQDMGKNLRSGQTGQINIRSQQGAMGPYLIAKISRFLTKRITKTHGL